MSLRHEVLIRIALLQRQMLTETKNRTLKCLKWHYSTVGLMKNVAVLMEDGAFALFGSLSSSPPQGILQLFSNHSAVKREQIIFTLETMNTTNYS